MSAEDTQGGAREEQPPYVDYYAVLGVEPTATRAEIRNAFAKIIKEIHPDQNAGEKDGGRVQEATNAWNVLSDEAERAKFDARRKSREDAERGERAAAEEAAAAAQEPVDLNTPFGQFENSLTQDGGQFGDAPRRFEGLRYTDEEGEEQTRKVSERLGEHAKFWNQRSDDIHAKVERAKAAAPEASTEPTVKEINGLQYLCDPTGKNILSEGYVEIRKDGDEWFGSSLNEFQRFGEADTVHAGKISILDGTTGKPKSKAYEGFFAPSAEVFKGRLIGVRLNERFLVDRKAGQELSPGFDSIQWIASTHKEKDSKTGESKTVDKGFLIGVRGNEQCLLSPTTGKRMSIMYDRIFKKDKNLMVGSRGGKEYLIDQKTGKEISNAYDYVGREKLGGISGYRDDVRLKESAQKKPKGHAEKPQDVEKKKKAENKKLFDAAFEQFKKMTQGSRNRGRRPGRRS